MNRGDYLYGLAVGLFFGVAFGLDNGIVGFVWAACAWITAWAVVRLGEKLYKRAK